MIDNSTERVKRWREKHRDEYLARQRDYYAKKRRNVAGVSQRSKPVDCQGVAGPVGKVDPLPDVPVETSAEKMARLMAAGRANLEAESVSVPESERLVRPARWRQWDTNRQRAWVRTNAPDGLLRGDEGDDARVADWLESLPAK